MFDGSRREGKEAKDKASSQGEEGPSRFPSRRSPGLSCEYPGYSQENETQSQANVGQEESHAQQGQGGGLAVAVPLSLFLD